MRMHTGRCCSRGCSGLSGVQEPAAGLCKLARRASAQLQVFAAQAGGLDGLKGDEQKLRKAIEFAAATGGYTTTQNGGIAAQPTYQQAMDLLKTADFAAKEE